MDHIQAVLTGDLIASSRHADRLDAAISALGAAAGPALRFTRFRGDGWQVLLPSAGSALRTALRLTAALAAADTGLSTRLAIGIGTVTRKGSTDLSDAAGPAFERSGRALDALGRATWAIAGGPHLPDWCAALVPLAERQATQWTRGQAEVAAEWLATPHGTQEERADRLHLTRQAWKSRFDGSGLAAWTAALHAWETWNGQGVTDD